VNHAASHLIADHLISASERILAQLAGSPEAADWAAREKGFFSPELPLLQVQAIFRLTDYERECLVLAAARELLPGRLSELTVGVAVGRLPGAALSSWLPTGPLRQYRLLELSDSGPYMARTIRMPESVLHFLLGQGMIDAELPVREVSSPRGRGTWTGSLTRSAASVGAAQAWIAGRNLRVFRANAIEIEDPVDFVARWTREALLYGAGLVLEGDPSRIAPRAHFPLVIVGPASLEYPAVESAPGPLEGLRREEIWRDALGEKAIGLNGQLSQLARQFRLDETQIRLASLAEDPWEKARELARRDLDGVAKRIETHSTWEDLILPAETESVLQEIVAQTRHRYRVYDDWGMAARSRRGLGIGALFHGPSGTGKTLAAEVMANELKVDLYHVDLSQMVSKYIGETEKNLEKVFTAAESAGALLLFDEADALFGKRSDVKDAHDRYANIEVGYLLQRIEAYDGLVVLTTNLKGSLDAAFLRRFRFVVPFPFPDADDRRRLWQGAFPETAPTEDIDPVRLARITLTGGSIRNIALAAAFLAAQERGPINPDRILRAARRELSKLERSMSELAEVGL
jgi:hypothetical protein